MSTSAQALVNSAVSLGYDALSERMAKECLLVAAQLGGGGGVSQIVAGTNVTVSPSGGTGAVTINASGGSGNPAPGVVNPNGNVTGAPGANYYNTANQTFWQQTSATTSNVSWIQLI